MTDPLSLVVAQIWQLTLVALVALVLARGLGGKRPYLATALWLVVLLKALTPPVWSSPIGLFDRLAPHEARIRERSPLALERAATPAVVEASDLTTDVLLGQVSHEVPTDVEPSNVGHTAGVPFEPDSPEHTAPTPTPTPAGTENDGAVEREYALEHEHDEGVALPNDGRWETRERRAPRAAEPAAIAVTPIHDRPTIFSLSRTRDWLGLVWLIGLLGIVLRAVRGWSRIRVALRDAVEPNAALVATFDETRRRLRIRRPVRLVVTQQRIGPAVVGLLRPTIVLPVVVVRGRSPRDLEPILVHELLHVRRGDLWIGALQLVVAGLWWFHPLVWWVNRSLTRDVERCCDAESVAALGRPPAEYARSLVAVLELKRDLEAVPAFPGVRPLDVTANRLERIMRLPTKPNPWTRWGSRLLLLALAALVLPGAAGQVEREGEEAEAVAPFTNYGTREITLVEDAAEEANPAAPTVTDGDLGKGLKVNVPALGPVPLAFDFSVPVLGTDVDERNFSFHLGSQDGTRTRHLEGSTDETAMIDDSPPTEPELGDARPPNDFDEPGIAKVLFRELGAVELRIRTSDEATLETRTAVADGPDATVEVIAGTRLDFEVVLRGKPVVAGRTKSIRLRRITDDSRPAGRADSIETETVEFQLVGDLAPLKARGAAQRLHVDLNANDGEERRILVMARDGVELESPETRMTAEGVALVFDPGKDDTAWRFDRLVASEKIMIAIRNGRQWQKVRTERLEMDAAGRIRVGTMTPFVSSAVTTIENGERVTRSDWPVPFVKREPFVATENAGPGVLPERTATPPDLDPPADVEPVIGPMDPPWVAVAPPAEAIPTKPNRDASTGDLVSDLLLGTSPALRPPTAEQVLADWQHALPIVAPLRVEFERIRYDHERQKVSRMEGSYRLESFAKPGVQNYASTYELTAPGPRSAAMPPGYRGVEEVPICIAIDGLKLTIHRTGPDLDRVLTGEEMTVVGSLRRLQVGYLDDYVRDNCNWKLEVAGKYWTLHGKPRPSSALAAHAKGFEIMLDAETARPNATKLILKDGRETVHVNLRHDPVESSRDVDEADEVETVR